MSALSKLNSTQADDLINGVSRSMFLLLIRFTLLTQTHNYFPSANNPQSPVIFSLILTASALTP